MTIVARSLATLNDAKSSLQKEQQDVAINAIQADVSVQSSLEDAAEQAEQVREAVRCVDFVCCIVLVKSRAREYVSVSRFTDRFLFSSARRGYRSQRCWKTWSRPSLRE